MKNRPNIAAVFAALAVLVLGGELHAQDADSARTESDRPMMRDCMSMMGSMEMESGSMAMMDSMRSEAEAALQSSAELGLTAQQVERLEEIRDEEREARSTSMEQMREVHESLEEASARARERMREVLDPEQQDRLRELTKAGTGRRSMHPRHGRSESEPATGEGGT